MDKIQIRVVNTIGSQDEEVIAINSGVDLETFLSVHCPESNIVVRVNGQSVDYDYELGDGDRVVITPANVKGA